MYLLGYRINIDALLARLVYPWRYRTVTTLLLLMAIIGLGSGIIPPFWNGRADLTITAAPGAAILVDGRSWPRQIFAGTHQIRATLPDGRGAWTDVALRAGDALSLTLPPGLPEPRERALPPATPGTHIDRVWWADGAWRVTSIPDPLPEPTDRRSSAEPTATPSPGQTVAISAQSVERLSTLNAYGGLADQLHYGNQLIEAVYHPNSSRGFGDQVLGNIEIRGWGATQTTPISAPLTLLRLSPNGDALLEAEQLPSGGEQIYLLRSGGLRVPLVAVPGHIARVSWRPDGSAVVLHSVQGQRLNLTLVRLTPSIIAAAIADLPAANYAGALIPLTWDDTGLLWVAPDSAGISALWSAPLSSFIPERMQPFEARALTRLPNGTLRVAQIQNTAVVIGRYQGEIFIGETVVPRILAAPELMGEWQGDQLLLQSDRQAWLLDVKEER